jgi:hypothetical protein
MEILVTMEILDARSPARPADDAAVAALFRARYQEMVRLAGLLGADDQEDVAQEAFAVKSQVSRGLAALGRARRMPATRPARRRER